MKLNLREIIEIPGGSVPFAQELDTALLDFPSVRAYTAPITAARRFAPITPLSVSIVCDGARENK